MTPIHVGQGTNQRDICVIGQFLKKVFKGMNLVWEKKTPVEKEEFVWYTWEGAGDVYFRWRLDEIEDIFLNTGDGRVLQFGNVTTGSKAFNYENEGTFEAVISKNVGTTNKIWQFAISPNITKVDLSNILPSGFHLELRDCPILTEAIMPVLYDGGEEEIHTVASIKIYRTGLKELDLRWAKYWEDRALSQVLHIYDNPLETILWPEDCEHMEGGRGLQQIYVRDTLCEIIDIETINFFTNGSYASYIITDNTAEEIYIPITKTRGIGFSQIVIRDNPNATVIGSKDETYSDNTLDLRVLTDMSTTGCSVTLIRNPLIEKVILNETITGRISSFQIYQSGIKGTLDISMFKDWAASCQIYFYNMVGAGLKTVLLPTMESGQINFFYGYNAGLEGELDMSGITRFTQTGRIRLYGNTLMTSIIFPTLTTGKITEINIRDCALSEITWGNVAEADEINITAISNGMSSSEVDDALIGLDASTTSGFADRSINIGGSNAAPGSAGLAAKASLEAKGWAVTVST